MSCRRRWAIRIDRALAGRSGRWAWRRLRAHVATCVACRDDYDRGVAALAALERTQPVAGVRAHLEADLFAALARASTLEAPRASPKLAPWRLRPGVVAAWGLAAAFLTAVLWWRVVAPAADPFQARGGDGVSVGFRVFCIRADGGRPEVRDAASSAGSAPARCDAGDRLQLTWSSPPGRHVALFSVGDQGQVQWYWPRTATTTPSPGGTDQPLPGSIDLAARHRPGRYRVIGMFATGPIDRYALERNIGKSGLLDSSLILSQTPGTVVDAWFEVR